MKRSLIFVFVLIFGALYVHGQHMGLRHGITFKKLFLDYQSQNGGSITSFKDYRHGYELGYQRAIGEKLAINMPLRYGVVDSHIDSVTCIKKKIASLDARIQYFLASGLTSVAPFFTAGVGAVMEDEGEFNVQIPVGLGFNFRIADNAYLILQSEFRYATIDFRNNLQHGLGFSYYFNVTKKEDTEKIPDLPVDSDGDGVYDDLDLCPNDFGDPILNGCPDKDGDGIADYLDKCPDIAGLKTFGGCPDTDGDGIMDADDECPKMFGSANNKGCPDKIEVKDSDGDGVADDVDKCPNQKGSIAAAGCPDRDNDGISDVEDKCPDQPGLKVYNGCPDTDGDGIDDSRDKCPKTPGTIANNGCPEIQSEDKRTLDIAMQAVQFETGSAILKPSSSTVLRQIADIMSRYPDFNMVISGHTDSVGSESTNQSLSEKRAKACYDFLSKEGVAPSRMTHAGFGESRPITTNINEKGRALNRRVEFQLVPR